MEDESGLTNEQAQRLWEALKETQLKWAVWWKPWRRCKAVKEPNASGYYGRCELDRDHNYAIEPEHRHHALERGFDTPRWSTQWTDGIDGASYTEEELNKEATDAFSRGWQKGWEAGERYWAE